MLTQECTLSQMFSIVLTKLEHRYFLEHLPVVDSDSIVFRKGT